MARNSKSSFPMTLWRIGILHSICVLLCCVSLAAVTNQKSFDDLCSKAPERIRSACKCESTSSFGDQPGLRLNCKNLNSTFDFLLEDDPIQDPNPNAIIVDDRSAQELAMRDLGDRVIEIIIRDSHVECVNIFSDFQKFRNLRQLTITRSNVKDLYDCAVTSSQEQKVVPDPENFDRHNLATSGVKIPVDSLHSLEILDLSGNLLTSIERAYIGKISHLRELNLSGNAIDNLAPKLFQDLKNLLILDLSSNKLDQYLSPAAFSTLPTSLRHLDISSNAWICSPKLSWIYDWSKPLISQGILARVNTTKCHYEDSTQQARLVLVMEYYTIHVLPACPLKDGCVCQLENIQEKLVTSTERHYTVIVSCPGKGLTHFPKLPKHTKTVDLSRNNLDNAAFSLLKVAEHNYNEVENLTLNYNKLESLPENLLEMKLGIGFSAKSNHLTSISYDFSQRLVKTTHNVELSDNPWICSCSSQITDLNLIAKLHDKKKMVCGPDSDVRLVNKQISQLEPELLCPPDTNGESQELLLQLLCGLLAILIVLIFTKLIYDTWVYRTRGQLPWLVLKMP